MYYSRTIMEAGCWGQAVSVLRCSFCVSNVNCVPLSLQQWERKTQIDRCRERDGVCMCVCLLVCSCLPAPVRHRFNLLGWSHTGRMHRTRHRYCFTSVSGAHALTHTYNILYEMHTHTVHKYLFPQTMLKKFTHWFPYKAGINRTVSGLWRQIGFRSGSPWRVCNLNIFSALCDLKLQMYISIQQQGRRVQACAVSSGGEWRKIRSHANGWWWQSDFSHRWEYDCICEKR